MITLEIKNTEDGGMLLCYLKAGKSEVDLLSVNDLGLPIVANNNSKQSYMAIDSLRQSMTNEDANIEYKIKETVTVDNNSLNTLFKYLNKNIAEVSILNNNLNIIYR